MRSCQRSNSISGWGAGTSLDSDRRGRPFCFSLSYLVRPRPETSVSSWEGEAKCSDLQWGQSLSSRYACLGQSGPQPRRVVPAAGWSRETNVRPPWRGVCLGGALPHPVQGARFILSYRTGELLDSHLTPARIQLDQHPSSLKSSLKIPPK